MKLTATCCCEKTGVTIEGEPALHAVCHCDNCKKRTGSAFGVSVYYKNEQVKNIFGDTSVYQINNEITQQRHFCKNCGSTVYWYLSSIPGFTGVAGGCFNSGELSAPKYTVSNEGKCAWLVLSDNLKTQLDKSVFDIA